MYESLANNLFSAELDTVRRFTSGTKRTRTNEASLEHGKQHCTGAK
jgi:hypothetical protein